MVKVILMLTPPYKMVHDIEGRTFINWKLCLSDFDANYVFNGQILFSRTRVQDSEDLSLGIVKTIFKGWPGEWQVQQVDNVRWDMLYGEVIDLFQVKQCLTSWLQAVKVNLRVELTFEQNYYILGKYYYDQGNNKTARDCFKKVSSQKAEYYQAQHYLGLCLIQQGYVDDNVDFYRLACEPLAIASTQQKEAEKILEWLMFSLEQRDPRIINLIEESMQHRGLITPAIIRLFEKIQFQQEVKSQQFRQLQCFKQQEQLAQAAPYRLEQSPRQAKKSNSICNIL